MFKKLNIRGVSHHFLLPVLAVLVVAGIGGYVMQRSSSAAVAACSQRIFRKGSSSVCTKYALTIIKRSGKSPTAKNLTPGSNFGPKTYTAIYEYQGKSGLHKDGVIGTNTWRKLCVAATTSERNNIGCSVVGKKPAATATGNSKNSSTVKPTPALSKSTTTYSYTSCKAYKRTAFPDPVYKPTCSTKTTTSKPVANDMNAQAQEYQKQYRSDLAFFDFTLEDRSNTAQGKPHGYNSFDDECKKRSGQISTNQDIKVCVAQNFYR